MKRLILLGCALLLPLSGSLAHATPPDSREPRMMKPKGPPAAEERLTRLARHLLLSEEQKNQILPILKDEAAQLQGVQADSTLSQDAIREKTRQIRAASHDKIRPLLNAEQQKRMDSIKERVDKRRSERRGPKPPPTGKGD